MPLLGLLGRSLFPVPGVATVTELSLDELTAAISMARARGDYKSWRRWLTEYQQRTRIIDTGPWLPLTPPPTAARPPRQQIQRKGS